MGCGLLPTSTLGRRLRGPVSTINLIAARFSLSDGFLSRTHVRFANLGLVAIGLLAALAGAGIRWGGRNRVRRSAGAVTTL